MASLGSALRGLSEPGGGARDLVEGRSQGAAPLLLAASGGASGEGSRGLPEPERVVAPVADPEAGESPEEASCLLCRLLFVWAFPTFWLGYRRGRTDLEDLPPPPRGDRPSAVVGRMPQRHGSSTLQRSLSGGSGAAITQVAADGAGVGRSRGIGPPRLLFRIMLATRRTFLQAMCCQALRQICNFAQPILLHGFLERLSSTSHSGGGGEVSLAAQAIGIAFAVMGMWIFAEYGWTLFVRADLQAQVALSHLTYRKSLFLTPGSSGYTLGDLQNHFATDCTKPTQAFLHAGHSRLVEAVVTISVVGWHLTTLIGSAGIVAMVVIAAFAPVQLMLSRRIKRYSKKIQGCRDVRGRLCSEFLSAMRVVKCFNLEETALEMISISRNDELRAQWGKRSVFPFNNFVASTTSLFGTIAAFTWLELVLDKPVDPAIAFTVLTWSNLLKSTIIDIPDTIATLLDAYVSIRRIECLLDTEPGYGSPMISGPMPDAASGSAVTPRSCNGASEAPSMASCVDRPGQECHEFVLQGCDLGWPTYEGHNGIHDITLNVRCGSLVMICGPIGSGKSVLLEGLAGTRQPIAGRQTSLGRPAAYVAQRPWLLNATVMENVTFGRPEDAGVLADVLDCVALGQDLRVLPDGLSTLVGEEGVQLSGGQKQRVSLARALYSQAEVVLMDDVLSALDAHVGRHVWDKAICQRLAGRTRILVTHQTQYCSHPEVDWIVLLNADGTVSHQGTFDDLRAKGVDFGVVVNQSKSSNGASDNGHGRLSDSAGKKDENGHASAQSSPLPRPPSVDSQDAEDNDRTPTHEASRFGAGGGGDMGAASNGNGVASGSSRAQRAAEGRRTGTVLFQDLVAYARACGGMGGVGAIAALIVVFYGSQLASSLQLAAWANANVKAEGSGGEARAASKRYLAQYLGLCLLTGVSCFSFFLGLQLIALRGSRNLHRLFMRGLLLTEMKFFDVTPTGRALNRCLKDMSTIDDSMPAAFRGLFEALMNVVTSTIVLACFAWQALFAVPPFAVLYWMIMSVYRWPARDLRRLEGVSRSPAMSHYADTVRGAVTIRAYQHEARFLRQNLALLAENQKTFYWFWVVQGWVSMSQEVLGTLLLAVVAAVIGYRASTGALSPGLAGLSLSYAMSMPRDLMWLSRRIANMEVEFVSIERVLEYARLASESEAQAALGSGGALDLPGDVPLGLGQDGGSLPRKPAVVGHDVRLRYDVDGPWVLDGLSFQIPVGARAALVGRTGCGKSSTLSALVRLYPTEGGGLFVHGREVRGLALPVLRSVVRVLLQDPIFFSGTIRSNLLRRPPPPDTLLVPSGFSSPPGGASAPHVDAGEEEALWLAVRQAGLEDRLRRMPRGLDTKVEESGQNFSQGERQLLCLARVLLSLPGEQDEIAAGFGPRLLLCDEPTSACDLATDEHIHKALLRGLPPDWTLIVVCHRLHWIREFDHVFRFEHGKVAECGSPDKLLSVAGGLAAMCREQGVL